jgi:hypothetical protein
MASQRQMVLTINQDLTRQGQAKLIKAQTLREELEFGDYYTINNGVVTAAFINLDDWYAEALANQLEMLTGKAQG